eukprot:6968755-Pyramimonas_sp.AAC.1
MEASPRTWARQLQLQQGASGLSLSLARVEREAGGQGRTVRTMMRTCEEDDGKEERKRRRRSSSS